MEVSDGSCGVQPRVADRFMNRKKREFVGEGRKTMRVIANFVTITIIFFLSFNILCDFFYFYFTFIDFLQMV